MRYCDPPDYIGDRCDACKEHCEPVLVDFGIGPNEMWGVIQNHHDWAWVSNCCEANLTDYYDDEEDG